MLARIMDNQVWFNAYLGDISGKGGSVRFAHHLRAILGRLPLVRAGDSGTTPFGYYNGCRIGAHCYNHDLASVDSADCCPTYFVNSWALGLSHDP